MGLREAGPRPSRDGLAAIVRTLRSHWRTTSLAAGWPFPSEWALPEVDKLCVAASKDEDLLGPAAEFARARANTGAGLAETLSDLAALHTVLRAPGGLDVDLEVDPDELPTRLLRATAVAWADVAVREATSIEVCDGLTGLATPAYLRTRLREVYAECELHGSTVTGDYVLVLVGVELDGTEGWSRFAALILLADVLRGVFDGGETLAVLGPCTVAALARRDERLSLNAASVRWLAADRFGVDPHLRDRQPRVWQERLPRTHEAACALLRQLGRG
ncbi:hypothetical protein [Sciscionella marina]|uniref:hypothetical protein n=1 Tax=Sciscionella marina TaxID=508770 RepID=UPI00038104C3|nr:hypothetical protein [Sciscionella marina]